MHFSASLAEQIRRYSNVSLTAERIPPKEVKAPRWLHPGLTPIRAEESTSVFGVPAGLPNPSLCKDGPKELRKNRTHAVLSWALPRDQNLTRTPYSAYHRRTLWLAPLLNVVVAACPARIVVGPAVFSRPGERGAATFRKSPPLELFAFRRPARAFVDTRRTHLAEVVPL